MEHRLDTHLKQLDEQAMADGEADGLQYCFYHDGYVLPEEMGDLVCLECEAGDALIVLEHMENFNKKIQEVTTRAVERVRANEEKVAVIGKVVQMTFEEGTK